jgi:hypothetical protein
VSAVREPDSLLMTISSSITAPAKPQVTRPNLSFGAPHGPRANVATRRIRCRTMRYDRARKNLDRHPNFRYGQAAANAQTCGLLPLVARSSDQHSFGRMPVPMRPVRSCDTASFGAGEVRVATSRPPSGG